MTDSLVGTLFVDKYEILQVLGQGGMGTVYKARNRINGSLRAIKLLNSHVELNAEALRRFDAEASAISRFKHENVIEIIDVGFVNQEQPYLVMEYIDGVSLSDLLKQQGALPVAQAIPLFTQICAALSSAHAHGVLHRDIKPSNIMLVDTPANRLLVKVVDFGIAKIIPNENDGTMIETATGIIIGSPPYMSPEQCLGEKLDLRSDIYSLGCLMYETLSGEPPLVGNSPAATMYKHLNEAPAPLVIGSVDLRLVNRLNQIFSKALNKLPERRYQSMDELRLDLETAMQQSRQGSVLLSLLQTGWSRVWQKIQNSLGSSRILFFTVLTSTVCLISALSLFAIPVTVLKVPDSEHRTIDWKPRPKYKFVNSKLQLKYETEKARLKELIKNTSPDGSSPELAELNKQLGDVYFDYGAYAEAKLTYQVALSEWLKLLSAGNGSFQPNPLLIHDEAITKLRYSQSELEMNNLNSAVLYAKDGMNWSFADKSGNPSYKAYLPQVIAVATIRVTHQVPPLMREYIINYLKFYDHSYDHSKEGETNSYMSARALSQIADAFLEIGLWQDAIPVLKRARVAWQRKNVDVEVDKAVTVNFPIAPPVGSAPVPGRTKNQSELERIFRQNCGPFNSAVATCKIADAEQHLGHVAAATAAYEEAANEFEIIGGKNDLRRIRTLLREADVLWQSRNFYKAFCVRLEALRCLSELSKTERET
jgi:serine/threonine protein kinase